MHSYIYFEVKIDAFHELSAFYTYFSDIYINQGLEGYQSLQETIGSTVASLNDEVLEGVGYVDVYFSETLEGVFNSEPGSILVVANCDEVQVVAESKTTTEKSLMGITGIIMEDNFFLVVVFTPLDAQVSQLKLNLLR